MSVSYGGPPLGNAAYGGGGYVPPRRASLEWINEAWRLFSAQAGTWIVSCIVAILLPLVLYFIFAFALGLTAALSAQSRSGFGSGGGAPGLSAGLIIFIALFWLVYGLLYMPFIYSGVYRMATRQVRGEPIGIGDIFGGGATTLRMLGYQIVYGLIGFALALVLSLPLSLLHLVSFSVFTHQNTNPTGMPNIAGIFAWESVFLFCYLMVAVLFFPVHSQVADGEGVFAAMGRSASAMKTQILPTLGLLFLFGLLYFVSAIPCGLGLFVTIPMFWLLSALAYRDMVGMPGVGLGMPGAPAYSTPQPGVWPPPPGAAPPPSFGQPPLPSGQPPAPSWQTPAPPPRQSLSGDPVEGDDDRPPGTGPTT